MTQFLWMCTFGDFRLRRRIRPKPNTLENGIWHSRPDWSRIDIVHEDWAILWLSWDRFRRAALVTLPTLASTYLNLPSSWYKRRNRRTLLYRRDWYPLALHSHLTAGDTNSWSLCPPLWRSWRYWKWVSTSSQKMQIGSMQNQLALRFWCTPAIPSYDTLEQEQSAGHNLWIARRSFVVVNYDLVNTVRTARNRFY